MMNQMVLHLVFQILECIYHLFRSLIHPFGMSREMRVMRLNSHSKPNTREGKMKKKGKKVKLTLPKGANSQASMAI